MKASVYCANLHHGGGASGAATFLNDLPRLHESGDLDGIDELEVVVSTTVARDLSHAEDVGRTPRVRLVVRDDPPRLAALWERRPHTSFDAQLVVRGPHYAPLTATRTVLGFADGTLYFPRPEGIQQSLRSRADQAIRGRIKRRLIARYDAYLVQTRRMADRLSVDVGGKPISIVPNSPSPLFSDPQRWQRIALPPRTPGAIRLFYPARGYFHKNHALIGPTARYLHQRHNLRLEVVTTLREAEFASLAPDVKVHCVNVGEVAVAQLPGLFHECDGVFFASLNEISSATPLEGMVMGRPVLASDRDFIREVAGTVPFYFDPLDPVSAGDTVVQVFRDGGPWDDRLAAGRAFVDALPSPFERSRTYMRMLIDQSG